MHNEKLTVNFRFSCFYIYCILYVQTSRSECDGNDGLVWKHRAAGRVDKKRKHPRRRDSDETENGHWQVLRSVQQQRSDRRSAESQNPRTWIRVQSRLWQVHVSPVQSKFAVNNIIYRVIWPYIFHDFYSRYIIIIHFISSWVNSEKRFLGRKIQWKIY